jgi:proline iminopeptidase
MAYKKIRTYKKGFLKVDKEHKIYYELSGNPKGKPVLFIHGGPGAGFSKEDKCYFNPKFFNIIHFDQRGAGRSKPFASIKNNTTFDLVNDIKKLLDFLKIKKTILFAGSWGSALALVYAIKHPETVSNMVLRGIFFGSEAENHFLVYEAQNIFPEAWDKMINLVPKIHQKKIPEYYYKMMTFSDKKIRKKFAFSWAIYEESISKLKSSESQVKESLKKFKFESFSIIELHYLINHCFLPKDYILKNTHKIKNIPISIIHGRYDHVARPLNAYQLHKKLPKSKLYFTFAGHSAFEKETEIRLVKEMDKLV